MHVFLTKFVQFHKNGECSTHGSRDYTNNHGVGIKVAHAIFVTQKVYLIYIIKGTTILLKYCKTNSTKNN